MLNKIIGMVFANVVILCSIILLITLIALSALKVINNIYSFNDSAYSANSGIVANSVKGKQ
jgi:hypothetical protein